MFFSCLKSALRHLARSRLYAFISIGGLSVGLCLALLAALLLRSEYTYDHFIPGYDRTYAMILVIRNPGLRTEYTMETQVRFAAQLTLTFPQIEVASRALHQSLRVRRGQQSAREVVYWVDPNFLDVLPMTVVAGDARTALHYPDGVVLTRQYARKYFGRDAPLGEPLEVGDNHMVVRAVIEDPPLNASDVQREILAAGIASNSRISQIEHDPHNQGPYLNWNGGLTYLRLKPGASMDAIRAAMPQFLARIWPDEGKSTVQFVRIDRLNSFEPLHPGFSTRMTMFGAVGAVVVLIAAINFVALLTTRSVRRAREVAIRKLAGAGRAALIAQFLGEAVLYAMLATVLALALTEWLLPHVNAFLNTGATLDYVDEPWLVPALLGIALALGILAGSYPALVVSALRPAPVLRSGSTGAAGSPLFRSSMVTLQFALLIALAICAGVVYRQRVFAMGEALRLNADQVLLVSVRGRPALFEELRKLPGVGSATRTGEHILGPGGFRDIGAGGEGTVPIAGRDAVPVNWTPLDFDAFDFFGIRPLAGELPTAAHPATPVALPGDVVLNETAARRLGFNDFAAAIGRTIPASPSIPYFARGSLTAPVALPPKQSRIVAVVPDFSLSSVEDMIPPTLFYQWPGWSPLVSLRLTGHDIPETLAAIDALWKRTAAGTDGAYEPPLRFFLDEFVQSHYLTMLRQAQALGIGAGVAMVLACIGLFALTSATAERCTREIGIRKAMGADTFTVVRLLLWQFLRPVLWAILIAWPASYWIMHRWLEGFAYHTTMPWSIVPATTAAALTIAIFTVITQAVGVARTRPIMALRYE